MSVRHYYDLCCKYKERPVKITTRDGRVHRGVIKHVDHHRVFIQPIQHGKGLGGFGYGGFYGPGYGYGGFGRGYGIALGTIAALALIPFFFW
ncbi:hypothetical protein SAMN04488072_102321 [Lentibacillus halodurans]|uniref:Uncharacterized protein n=1 Tax=Lentibacillus halodurans TaxID=237679 RepID=A0A1I0W918_9BACI|nr:hypothetical protein [Lentibacillus halodurans]SFA85245.1 hypothetical protein SAMN04488072_102321 [Lentibacillus halodurans]